MQLFVLIRYNNYYYYNGDFYAAVYLVSLVGSVLEKVLRSFRALVVNVGCEFFR